MSSDSVDPSAAAHSGEWLSARQSRQLVCETADINQASASRQICNRAYAGLIPSRAKKVVVYDPGARLDPQRSPDLWRKWGRYVEAIEDGNEIDIDQEFWWARGAAALEQDWPSGDFSTSIEQKFEIRFYGVEFEKSGLLSLLGLDEMPAEFGNESASLSDAEPTSNEPGLSPMDQSTWSMAMAIEWIATDEPPSFNKSKSYAQLVLEADVDEQRLSKLQKARYSLWAQLENGDFTASAVDREDNAVLIRTEEWPTLKLGENSARKDILRVSTKAQALEDRYKHITFKRSDLEKLKAGERRGRPSARKRESGHHEKERAAQLHHVIQGAIQKIPLPERKHLNDTQLGKRIMTMAAVKSLNIGEDAIRAIVGNRYGPLKGLRAEGLRIDKLITDDNDHDNN